MSQMRVEQALCTLCGTSVEVCPFAGVVMTTDSTIFTDACRLCNICAKACPTNAIWLEKSTAATSMDLTAYQGVLVFAEQRQGQIQPVTYELIGKGLELAQQLGQEVAVCLAGW